MARDTVVTWRCDGCLASDTFNGDEDGRTAGWRTLTIKFDGAPYPEFSGDLCPACFEKARSLFASWRPGAAAAMLLEGATLKTLTDVHG